MLHTVVRGGLALLMVCMWTVRSAPAQESKAAATARSSSKDDTKKEVAKPSGRLPKNWGKLGLTAEQKQRIYEIQGKHHEQISALEGEIAKRRRDLDEEMRSVLTPDQVEKLKQTEIEAKKKSEEKRKSRTKKSTDSSGSSSDKKADGKGAAN